MKRLVLFATVFIVAVGAAAQEHHQMDHGAGAQKSATAQEKDPALPASEENALAVLNVSPRHGEFIDVPYEGSAHPIKTWVVYPERKDKAPVVIVICEIFGLSDWLRAVADQLSNEGFIAVAPDLISGMGPGGGGTSSVSTRDSVVQLIRGLSPAETYKRLDAVRSYAIKLPAANGKSGTVGYCWGGGRSFGYACSQSNLNGAVVYYGSSPDSSELIKLKVPVLGLYGGDDARVNATVEPAAAQLTKSGASFEYEMFDGAGHGFLRAQSGREGANMRATRKAWPRTVAFLRKHLGG